MTSKPERLAHANILLQEIASHGRHFFRSFELISRFELDPRNRLWWIDKYKSTAVYVGQRQNNRFRGFSEGGTLKALMLHLAVYIRTGEKLPPSQLGPWPQWYSEGDPWGYGLEAMNTIRSKAKELGVIECA